MMIKNCWARGTQCRTVIGAALLGMMFTLVAGCGGGGDSGSGAPAPVSVATGTVTGQVVSLANNTPVSGATVRTDTGTTTTASNGRFTVPAPAGDRTVVRVEANGFAEAFPVARVLSGQTTNLGLRLVPIGVTETVSVSSGGTVSVPNSPARVVIPANGLVPAAGGTPSGSVNVSVTPINPAEEPSVMPGGFNGIPSGGGSAQPLESGGAMQLAIRDSGGTRYALAQGSTATVRIPLATQSANPPATMPLWFFDETAGIWREDGTATLQGSGSNRYYEGTVTRVTYWNADLVLDSIVVKGCVKDANGQPVANAWVQTEGIDYTGVAYDSTAADGTFSVAMRRSSRAKLGLFEFAQQTVNFVPVSNTVTVGPSATDITLTNCLVKQPGALAVTTSALPGGNVGVAYNQTLAAAGGVPGYVWSLNTGSNPLPEGLSLNPAGVISGTPTAAGTTTITVKVTDSAGGTTTKEFTITVTAPNVQALAITTAVIPPGTVATAYNTTVAATGGTGSKSWSISSGALPAGLSLNASTGVISGAPTTAGTSTFTVRIQDSSTPQLSAERQLTILISPIGGGGTGGGSGTLTVSNAPASVNGTFVVDPQFTRASDGGIAGISLQFLEAPSGNHDEGLNIIFNVLGSGTVDIVVFGTSESLNDRGLNWACSPSSSDVPRCSGITLNRSVGTVSFVNAVLTEEGGKAPPVTLNGTVTFPPL